MPPEANTEWGQLLRIHTLRSRPAYMRLAVARSTTGWRVRQASGPDPHQPHGLGGGVAAATPVSRVVRPRASPCGRSTLDTEAPPPAQQHSSAEPPVRRAPNRTRPTTRDTLDKPFHMRMTTPNDVDAAVARRSGRILVSMFRFVVDGYVRGPATGDQRVGTARGCRAPRGALPLRVDRQDSTSPEQPRQ